MKHIKLSLTKLLVVLGSLALCANALASGFQIFDQDSNQSGTYYAAGAAGDLNSAGSEFYNPAVMTHFDHTTMSLGVVNIYTHIKFTGSTSIDDDLYFAQLHRLFPRLIPVERTFVVANPSGEAQGGGPNYVPNFHVIVPVDKQWAIGFGLTTPFGLESDYDPDSFAANAASLTEIKTINLNPTIAYRPLKWLSVGVGFDAQYAYGKFDQDIHVNALPVGGLDLLRVNQSIKNDLNDWAYGWNAGVLVDINPDTRLGLSYRSGVSHKAKGESKVDINIDNDNLSASNNNAEADIPLPPTTILSLSHDFNKQWTVMGSAFFTQWNKVQQIVLQNVQLAPGMTRDVALQEGFKNTWNLSLGAKYHFAKAWTAKMGVGYDQSPVNDEDRDIRLPDSDRRIVALGMEYQPTDQLRVNLGYMHFFTNPAPINHTAETISANLPVAINFPNVLTVNEAGTSYANADVFSLGVNYQF